jgi:hypothetical protein
MARIQRSASTATFAENNRQATAKGLPTKGDQELYHHELANDIF